MPEYPDPIDDLKRQTDEIIKKTDQVSVEVIVINDMDGHCGVYEKNIKNLKALLRFFLDSDWRDEVENYAHLLDDPHVTAKQLEEIIPSERSHGGHVYFVTVKKEMTNYNPLL